MTSGIDNRGIIVIPAAESSQRVLWIFLFAFAAGIATVLLLFRSQGMVSTRFDPYFFGEMGKSIANGDGFASYGSLIKRRAPLYPLVIGGVYTLFGERPAVVLLFQCILLASTCILVYDLGRRMFNERTGVIAALVCALHPMTLRYVADLHLETLLTFLFTLTVWLTLRLYEEPTQANGLLTGVAAGFTALTKAVVLPYPVFFAGALALSYRRAGRRIPWTSLAVMFAAMGLAIAPWTLRNYGATGHFVPISSGMSDAFLRGYVFSKPDYALLRRPPYTDAENEVNAMFRRICGEQGAVWEQDDYETDQILNRAMKAKLLTEPGDFVRKFAVGLFTFWYQMTSLANSLLVGVLALAAIVLAAIGGRRAFRERRPAWLLLLPAVYLNLMLATLLALGRYSAPVLPALLVVSAYGVDTLLLKRKLAHG